MRTVSYKTLNGIGPGKTRKQGTIADLLLDIPYFHTVERIPSLDSLNAMLGTGFQDSGMSGGCEWKPFAITPDEYAEVVEELMTNPRMSRLRNL